MFTFDMSFEQYAESMKVICDCGSLRYNMHTADCSLIRLRKKWSQGSQELWEVIKQKELLKQKERTAKEEASHT